VLGNETFRAWRAHESTIAWDRIVSGAGEPAAAAGALASDGSVGSGSSPAAAKAASRGEARTDAGAIRLALADFKEALRLKKDNMAALAGRGRASGNTDAALADGSGAAGLN
jgi:hypothetical protein